MAQIGNIWELVVFLGNIAVKNLTSAVFIMCRIGGFYLERSLPEWWRDCVSVHGQSEGVGGVVVTRPPRLHKDHRMKRRACGGWMRFDPLDLSQGA